MRLNLLISLVLLTFMTGCTSFRSADSINLLETFQQEAAKDTVKELVRLYPPAHTQLEIRQRLQNSYSTCLINMLRSKGYGLVESKESFFQKNHASNTPGTTLFYVIDRLGGSNIYRVSIAIGHQQLSRAYRLKNGHAFGLGSWTKTEQGA